MWSLDVIIIRKIQISIPVCRHLTPDRTNVKFSRECGLLLAAPLGGSVAVQESPDGLESAGRPARGQKPPQHTTAAETRSACPWVTRDAVGQSLTGSAQQQTGATATRGAWRL